MVTKNKLHRFLSAIVLLAASAAHAECYTRSATVSQMTSAIERIADLDRKLLPANNNQLMCRITFRAYINGSWHNAMGEEVGPNTSSLDTLCSKAMNSGRVSILESVSGTKVTANQEMICTDEPKKQQRTTVHIGDLVWESEVQIHPLNRNAFNYRGSICRWFVESNPQAGRIELMQGIICRAPEQKVFTVVDKW